MVIKDPCKICERPVAKNHHAINCDICETWVHIKCNRICKKTYQNLQNKDEQWYCIECFKHMIPYSNLNDHELMQLLKGKNISNFLSQPSNIFEQLNKIEIENNESNENSSNYYNIDEFNNLNKKKNDLSILHLNIASLQYHLDDLHAILSESKTKFDFIGTLTCLIVGGV